MPSSALIYAVQDGANPIYTGSSSEGVTLFSGALTHGGINTSTVYINASGGRLFRLTSTAGRTSSDGGAVWANCTGLDASYAPTSMFFYNDQWHLFSVNYFRSSDGIDFVNQAAGEVFGVGAHIGDTFLVLNSGADGLYRSTNAGTAWSSGYAFDWGVTSADMLIATDETFILFPYDATYILSSATGASGSWDTTLNPADHNINDAAYGNGLVVGVSNGGQTVVSSDKGATFTLGANVPRYGGGSGGSQDIQNNKLIYSEGAGLFFFATTSLFNTQSIYSSPDGQEWTQVFTLGSASTIDSLAEVSTIVVDPDPDPVELNIPTSKNCYIYDLGDDINGQKQFQHLVTMDTPEGELGDAKVTKYGMTVKYGKDLYCLPLPGEVSEDAYRNAPKQTYEWKSKKFVFPGRMTMAAAKVTKDCGGTLILSIYVDCRLAYESEICDCKPFRLPTAVEGIEFEILLKGTAKVTEVHIASSIKELIESE